MKTRGIFFSGERGYHLLFDTSTIEAAFSQNADRVQDTLAGRTGEIESVLVELLALPTVQDARRFIRGLPCELQHVLVHLYFEVLEGRLRATPHTLH